MNLNGFYQTNNKSITNTSSSFSNTQSTPPKVNNTTNEFGNEVTFNQGLILPAGSSISIVDGEGTLPLASTDLSDNADIAYLDLVNNFTSLPIFTDAAGIAHQFLIANPDTSTESGKTNHHLSATTTSNNGSNHTTTVVPVPIPSHVTEKVDGSHTHGLAFFSHLDPDGEGPLTHSLAKMSPYRVVTGDANGALIGSYITSDKFASWVFGELTGVKENGIIDLENNRDEADQYKHGLVPKGAVYIDGEAQEFLRKDGNWQSITDDLSKINGNLQPKPGVSNVNMGTAQNKFNNLYINSIICGGTAETGMIKTDTATISDMGWTNFAGFAHKDMAGQYTYALNQSNLGKTMINSADGETINFRCNNVTTIYSDVNGLKPYPTNEKDLGSTTLKWRNIYGVNGYFGNATISDMGFPNPDSSDAGFAQKDHANTTSYALLQDKEGETYINTAVGKKINFKVGQGQNLADFTTNAAHFTVPLECPSITTTTAAISDMGLGSSKAGFSPRDCANGDNYALLQEENGTTSINSSDGMPINFTIETSSVAKFYANEVSFVVPITSPDADTAHEFGRAKIGYVGHADYAGFGHRDHFNTSSYGFLQGGSNGDTLVNTSLGGTIFLRCNNNTLVDFTATAANFSVPLEVASIKISIDGNDTIITPLSGTSGSYAFKTDQNANNTTVHANHTSNLRGNGSVIHVGNLSNGNVGVMMSHSTTFSDSRLKTNQVDYLDGWDDFKTIKIKKYNRYGASESRIGVIADDIKIHPVPLIQDSYSEISGVTELSGVEYEDLGGVDYQILYRMNIAVTQQLMARVEALEAKIISLLNNG